MLAAEAKPNQASEDKDLPQGLQIGVLDDKNLCMLVEFRRETNKLDYKSTFNISDKKTCHDFSRGASALSNTGGGYIVVGVEPKAHRAIGIDRRTEKNLDPTRISQAISRFISPSIDLHTYVGDYTTKEGNLRIGLIYVPEFKRRPHFINGDYDYLDKRTDERTQSLREGTIYVRRHSASKPIDSDSWEELLERYYTRTLRLRETAKTETDSDGLFELDRKEFFERAFKELAR